MVGTVARTRLGPETFEVNVQVDGGMLVEFDAATAKIKPAIVDSAKWLGVALMDAMPAGTTGEDLTFTGAPRIATDVPRPEVAVAWHGSFKLKAVAALNAGDIVYCGANGTVQKATVTGRAVGIVIATAGIAAGAYGLIRLF